VPPVLSRPSSRSSNAPLPSINRSQSPYGTIQGGRNSPYASTPFQNARGISPSPHHANSTPHHPQPSSQHPNPSPHHTLPSSRPPPPPAPPRNSSNTNSDGAPLASVDPDVSLGSLSDNAYYPGEDRIPHIDSSMSDAALTPVTSGGIPFDAASRPPVAPKPKPPTRPPLGSGGGPADAATPADRIRVLTHNGSISSDDSD
jgi:hypothetical protein